MSNPGNLPHEEAMEGDLDSDESQDADESHFHSNDSQEGSSMEGSDFDEEAAGAKSVFDMVEIDHFSDCEEPTFEKIDNKPKVSNRNDNFQIAATATAATNASAVKQERNGKVYVDKGIQASSSDSRSTCPFVKTEKNLMIMCNINSFKIVDQLAEQIDQAYPAKTEGFMNTRDSILLLAARFASLMDLPALGVLFQQPSSRETTRRNFYDTMKKLAAVLQPVAFRVPKEEIIENTHKNFNKCMDIIVEEPTCLKCRYKFRNLYKGGLKVTLMTKVTPEGRLTFISELREGQDSDFMRQVNEYLKNKKAQENAEGDMMVEEALVDKETASASKHSEKINKYIKKFKILNRELPLSLVNYIDDIFLICCGLANLGIPFVADEAV